MRAWLWLCLCVLSVACWARPALSQEKNTVEDAKAFFKAGAAAYTAGDYLAAIQALDAAYRLTPLPAIAFSLAQAERRQYFVSRERPHLERAVALYRRYLAEVPSGGRRADATDALSQLEPIALAQGIELGGAAGPVRDAAGTRLLVSSSAPGAKVSLDGGTAAASPFIAEVTPGEHLVQVEAPGYFPNERRVTAVAGALLPVEVELQRRPARLIVQAVPTVDVYVDGEFVGKAGKSTPFDLPSGRHSLGFARKGYRIVTRELTLLPGESRTIGAGLKPTSQRTASLVLMAGSMAAASVGVIFGAVALGEEEDARRIYVRQQEGNITPAERKEYEESLDRRNDFGVISVGALIAATVSVVTGVCLHELDSPNLRDAFAPARGQAAGKMRVSLAPASNGGVDAMLRF
jgi:tetratricopeptide (TPR) repeat protein